MISVLNGIAKTLNSTDKPVCKILHTYSKLLNY